MAAKAGIARHSNLKLPVPYCSLVSNYYQIRNLWGHLSSSHNPFHVAHNCIYYIAYVWDQMY